jgi:hypothetical protein
VENGKKASKFGTRTKSRAPRTMKNEEVPGKGGAYKDWPRGHKPSKTDLHRQASSIALENTLKSVFVNKKEASAKRDERKCRDKEEKMQSFADIQRKTLEVQQRKLDLAEVKERVGAKELELKTKECEDTLLAVERKIMMADLNALDPERRAWFEENQTIIRARGACLYLFLAFGGHELNHVTGLITPADLITVYVICSPLHVICMNL